MKRGDHVEKERRKRSNEKEKNGHMKERKSVLEKRTIKKKIVKVLRGKMFTWVRKVSD